MLRLILLITCVYSSLPSFVRADSIQVEQFKQEFPAAALRLDEQFSHVKGTCKLWTTMPPDFKMSMIDEASFYFDHGFEKIHITRSPNRNSNNPQILEMIYCIGENSNFYVDRVPGAKQFSVRGIGADKSDRDVYFSLFGTLLRAHQGSFGRPLSQAMLKPAFNLLDAQRINKDNRTLVKIDYEFGPVDRKSHTTVFLDPAINWSIRASEYHPYKSKRFSETQIEYGDTVNGIALPKLVKLRDIDGGLRYCKFTSWSFEPTPIEEFRMPFYSLPDLVSERQSSGRTWPWWLIGTSLTLMILGFIFFWLSSHRKQV